MQSKKGTKNIIGLNRLIMELGLSLGETPKSPFEDFMEKPNHHPMVASRNRLGFCMALSIGPATPQHHQEHDDDDEEEDEQISKNKDGHDADDDESENEIHKTDLISEEKMNHSILQLDLLPNTPVPRNFLLPSSANGAIMAITGNFENKRRRNMNRLLVEDGINNNDAVHHEDGGTLSSSPNNSASASSFQMDFCMYTGNYSNGNNKDQVGGERGGSDEDENGSTRKKLRLSKEQSAFLEESFKEHNTLNPKQKLALSKQLNLRPRQVEVWFQNRRARTKLKQTEVDCEYLKRCCETLTEENRRLQKELQELRALKTSNPFYMQSPATTLTMCPSCEKVAATTTTNSTASAPVHKHDGGDQVAACNGTGLSLTRPRTFYPFTQAGQANSHPEMVVKQIEK